MNKIKILSLFLVSAAAVLSCTKQDQPSVGGPTVSIIHASLVGPDSEPDTRTHLGGKTQEGYPVLWEEGDTLAVSNYDKSAAWAYFGLKSGSGSMSGEFEQAGASTEGFKLDTNKAVSAFYPRKNVINKNSKSWKIRFPTVQKYKSGDSFGHDAMPMLAYASSIDSTLRFKSLMSVLKLQLTSEEVDSVTRIHVLSSHALSGEISVLADKGTLSSFSEGVNYLILICDEPVRLSSEVATFHIVVPPVEHPDLTVVIETTRGRLYKRSIDSTSLNFTANMIKKMKPLELKKNRDLSFGYRECSYDRSEPGDTTDYGPGIFLAGTYWAPENCGIGTESENPLGLLFQWGRKYGQPHFDKNGDTLKIDPGIMSYGDAQKKENHSAFCKIRLQYYPIQTPWRESWWSDELVPDGFADSWNGADAPYNPCPDGWRLPDEEDFERISNANYTVVSNSKYECNSFLFSEVLLIPMCGLRYDYGNVLLFSKEAHLWTSSLHTTDGGDAPLYCNLMPISKYRPLGCHLAATAQGKSVRCVHDIK